MLGSTIWRYRCLREKLRIAAYEIPLIHRICLPLSHAFQFLRAPASYFCFMASVISTRKESVFDRTYENQYKNLWSQHILAMSLISSLSNVSKTLCFSPVSNIAQQSVSCNLVGNNSDEKKNRHFLSFRSTADKGRRKLERQTIRINHERNRSRENDGHSYHYVIGRCE